MGGFPIRDLNVGQCEAFPIGPRPLGSEVLRGISTEHWTWRQRDKWEWKREVRWQIHRGLCQNLPPPRELITIHRV